MKNKNYKLFAMTLSLILAASSLSSCGKTSTDDKNTTTTTEQTAPEKPDGEPGDAPEKPDGEPGDAPEKPDGEPPADGKGPGDGGSGGDMGPGAGGPGGSNFDGIDNYDAVKDISEDTSESGKTYTSTGTDENAVRISGQATAVLTDSTVSRTSSDSTGGDNSSFYGVGAAVLATEGTAYIKNADISTDASGGAGIFSYGNSVVYIADSAIKTLQNTSGVSMQPEAVPYMPGIWMWKQAVSLPPPSAATGAAAPW